MQFTQDSPLYSYQVEREGGEDVLYINYLGASFVPSIAESPEVMERVIDALMQNPNVSRVLLVQQKNYNYDIKEVAFLLEIAQLYNYFLKQERILSQEKLAIGNQELFPKRYNDLFTFITLLRRDPLAAYFELKKILSVFEGTRIIQELLSYLDSYSIGNREIYNKVFKSDTIPNFTFTRLVSDLPDDAEIVDQYKIAQESYDESLVTILRKPGEIKLIYHLVPPENSLPEDHTILLNQARGVLIEHQPKAEEFTDTDRVRQVFFNISKDLLQDLGQSQGMNLSYSDITKLATILVRHTIGFGLIEVLLQDKNLQDISLNAPISMTPIFIRHQNYDECMTNIIPSQEDADSWAGKFRMISGRPLDEANPILDTQLEIGKISARIAIIQRPLSPQGLAYSIRRHREDPWTLPLFVQNKMLNP